MVATSRFELLQQKKEISHDQPDLKHSEHNMVNFQKETTSKYIWGLSYTHSVFQR
jgi:hypothetical protein